VSAAHVDGRTEVAVDFGEVAREIDRSGFAILEGLLAESEVEDLRSVTAQLVEFERRAGVAYMYGDGNQRVWSLLAHGEIYFRLAEHAAVLGVLGCLLGNDLLLSNFTANVIRPGTRPMSGHWDQVWAPRPWPVPLVAQAIWMVDDFTEHNGATALWPRSHLASSSPAPDASPVRATGRAGTCVLYDGRIWHAVPENESTRPRTAILAYYCRSFVRQQESFSTSLSRRIREGLSRDRRCLLGLDYDGVAGMVDGPPRDRPHW
jgi:hypothetical protein